MTRNEFVKRLQHILETKPEPCQCCPGARRYDGLEPADYHRDYLDENCELCQGFMDFRYIRPDRDMFRPRRACPCARIGSERAIERARKYLKQWHNGEHKWQRQ